MGDRSGEQSFSHAYERSGASGHALGFSSGVGGDDMDDGNGAGAAGGMMGFEPSGANASDPIAAVSTC